jgi:hypothetical protein
MEEIVALIDAADERKKHGPYRARQPAESTGNQGITLLLAERYGDVMRAQTAVKQIEVAFMIMRDGGNAAAAAYCEAQLLRARALFVPAH